MRTRGRCTLRSHALVCCKHLQHTIKAGETSYICMCGQSKVLRGRATPCAVSFLYLLPLPGTFRVCFADGCDASSVVLRS